MDDAFFMREALDLAREGYGKTSPNPMVGAVVVRDGVIVGRGFHQKAGGPHAEIHALRDAGEQAENATIYVTLEPCSTHGRTPPCTEAIKQAGIKRVVCAVVDPNPAHAGRGFALLRDAGIEVTESVLEDEAKELNKVFFKYIRTKRPYVLLKMAMTLDGRIATAPGDSRYVTGPEARSRVQYLRRGADAIMIGGETLRMDQALLTVREPENWKRQPLRLIASASMTQDELTHFYPEGRAELVRFRQTNWSAFLDQLGTRPVTMLLLEGGGRLAAMALEAGAVDEVEFHIAPKLLLGEHSRMVTAGHDPMKMAEALELTDVKWTRYGEDMAVSGRVGKGK